MSVSPKSAAFVLAAAAIASVPSAALADFTGQTILGPLTLNTSIFGNNTGHSDDNDGFTSGDHFFFIWEGGDDVYALNWLGGDMHIRLDYSGFGVDVDLFLYTPGDLNDSSIYSVFGPGPDFVTLLGAPAGTYYIVVDSPAGNEGAYQLSVVPAPSAAGLLALGGLLTARRRRR